MRERGDRVAPDLQGILARQGAPASHLQRIDALVELIERSSTCVALALVGSYAAGSGDRISDLDLVAFVERGCARSFVDEADQILSSSDVFDQFHGEHADQGCFRKYVYLDFSSCELHAFEVSTTFRLHRPFTAVWNPRDFLSTLTVDGPPPRHEDLNAYTHGDAGLTWELFDCIKWLKRGRRQLTRDYLRKLVAGLDRQGP